MTTLSTELLVKAYRAGLFPMGRGRSIDWYSPDPRAILPLDGFRVSRSLARTVRAEKFEIVSDRDFEGVIDACAKGRPEWITRAIREAYVELHRRGHAHSVEAYQSGRMVGGLYGVHIGGAFMGESMFHRSTDASKVCLVALVERMRRRGFDLLDVQFTTSHLVQFGVIEVPRAEYLRRLERARDLAVTWAP